MSGDQYRIKDQHACHFLTLTVIHWIDIFTRVEYKDIIVDSLNHCIKGAIRLGDHDQPHSPRG